MSVPSVSLFIIISAPYATSVPLYLKTWPKWLRVFSLTMLKNYVLFGTTQKNISKLQKAQNLMARVVTSPPRFCSPRTLLQQLYWLPIKHRIDFKIANITFHTLHSSQPAYLRSSLAKETVNSLGNPCSESWRRKRKGCGGKDLQKRKVLSLEWKSELVYDRWQIMTV